MTRYYIDKEQLFTDIVDWQDRVVAAKAIEAATPVMPDSVGRAILDIATHMSTRWNFRDYSWIDEMVGDGIEAATRAIPKFDRENEKKNPFGFLTFIIWRAFVNRLKLEKKLHENKMAMMLDETIDSYDSGDSGNEIGRADMIGMYSLNS